MYAAAYVWAKVIACLEARLGELVVRTALEDVEILERKEGELALYSPSPFRREQLARHYAAPIRDALREQGIAAEVVVCSCREREEGDCLPVSIFRFDTYVEGEGNALALQAAMAAAAEPGGNIYNPLFLYGPPGVGKTHLLCAVAHRVRQTHPEKKVVYVKAEQFTDELVAAIMGSGTAAFRKKYRSADVLLVDDLQFIAGKESTQEEFYYTFNALYESGRQIVLTADRKPGDMPTLEDRLRDRFGGGVLVGIRPPDLQTRREIICRKARWLEVKLPAEAAEYLAEKTENTRQIEGALRKLRALRDLTGMELTLQNVSGAIGDLCPEPEGKQLTAKRIVQSVCRYYGLEEGVLCSSRKGRSVAVPRQMAMYLIRLELGMSLTEIGKLFSRDHGTVHYALSRMERRLREEESLRHTLRELRGDLGTN